MNRRDTFAEERVERQYFAQEDVRAVRYTIQPDHSVDDATMMA